MPSIWIKVFSVRDIKTDHSETLMPSRLFEFDNPFTNHSILVYDLRKPLVMPFSVVFIFMKCVERMGCFFLRSRMGRIDTNRQKISSYLCSW